MFGQTIQEIRKSKNMTLKEAAGDALSISQLSRFENGKSMIPVDLFYKLLNNLNTTTEEFKYIRQPAENNRMKDLFLKIEEYNNEGKLQKLSDLKDEIKASHPGMYSWEQFSIYFIDSILETHDLKNRSLEIFENKSFKAQQPVLDYLMQVENWGEMELRLYGLFGFVLDIETTHFLMRTALKKSKQYLDIPAAKNLLHDILSNNFSTFLFNDHLEYAEETIELFEKHYSEDTEAIGPHIDFLFNRGLLAFKHDKPEEGKKYCEQAISICRLFKQKASEKTYVRRYKSWQKNYKDPEFKELTIKIATL